MYMKQLQGLILLWATYALVSCSTTVKPNACPVPDIKPTNLPKIIEIFAKGINKDIVPVIKRFEGISLVVYNDLTHKVNIDSKGIYKRPKRGYLTVGIGHRITESERKTGQIKLSKKKSIDISKAISNEDAELILLHDLERTKGLILKYVKVGLSQQQFNMLASLVFNVGIHAFFKKTKRKIDFNRQTTLLKYLNGGEKFKAGLEFMEFVNVKGRVLKGLVDRRQYEMNLFLQDTIKRM